MKSSKRASQILVALSAWALMSVLMSMVIIKIIVLVGGPSLHSNLTSDIQNIQDLATLKKICVLLVDGAAAQKQAGWLLVSWGLWFVATWAAIFGMASVYLYRQLNSSKEAETYPPTETMLDLAIDGKLALWKAFWGLYIVLPYVAALVIYGLVALLKHFHVIEPAKVADLIVTPLAYSAIFVIWLGAAVVAWRCSGNTSRAVWRYLARTTIVLLTGVPIVKAVVLLSYYLARYG